MKTSTAKQPVQKPPVSTAKKVQPTTPKAGQSKSVGTGTPSQVKKDSAGVSREAREAGASSSRVNGLLSGIQDWGANQDVKPAGGEVKPMSLEKGELIKRGMSGDKVEQLQQMLKQRGAKDLKVDGDFGPNTQKALKEFQKKNKLTDDGVLGPDTLGKLNAKDDGVAKADGPAKTDKPGQVDPAKDKGSVDKGDPAAHKPGQTDKAGRFKDTRAALDKLPGPLKKYADTFQKMGEKYGVDPRFLASISMHETGKGTSSAFRNKNNAMGISSKKGPIRMSSVEASIEKMAQGLSKSNGYYKGKTTIGQIGKVYAPIGASNDPNGLNGYWAKGVAKNYKMFGGDPTQQVIFR